MEDSKMSVALFDLDDTLCDYDKAMIYSLEKLRSPKEPKTRLHTKGGYIPPYEGTYEPDTQFGSVVGQPAEI